MTSSQTVRINEKGLNYFVFLPLLESHNKEKRASSRLTNILGRLRLRLRLRLSFKIGKA
jgi:hypothetical protein